MAKKTKTRSQLVKELDTVFSRYYRQSQSDSNGYVTCYTCGSIMPWKDSQTGHFFTRGRQATRWDIDNVRIQDYRCNIALKGNYIVFTRNMIKEIGEQALDKLEFKSLNGDKITTPEIRDMIEHYRSLSSNISTTRPSTAA